MKDLHNNIAIVQLLAPQTLTADTYSKILDLQNFESAEILINVGTCATVDSTANYVTPKIEESDSLKNADFAAVDSANLLGALAAIVTTDAQIQKVGYVGNKRYIRILADATGTVGGVPMGVVGILSLARHNPAVAPAALATTG
jgi:hypothetical protein